MELRTSSCFAPDGAKKLLGCTLYKHFVPTRRRAFDRTVLPGTLAVVSRSTPRKSRVSLRVHKHPRAVGDRQVDFVAHIIARLQNLGVYSREVRNFCVPFDQRRRAASQLMGQAI